MINKINCFDIFVEHIQTLKSNRTGKTSMSDIFGFYVVPIMVGVAIAYYFPPPETLVTVLITMLSIFSALLFSILVLILDAVKKATEATKPNERLVLLLRQTYTNIAYSILVSLFGIVALLIPYFFDLKIHTTTHKIVGAVIYAVLLHFLFTIAMVLKRMNIVFNQTMEKQ